MLIDNVLIPEPVVKKLTIKSSSDIVNDKSAPAITPGKISGKTTLKKAYIGDAPKSKAASSNADSIVEV